MKSINIGGLDNALLDKIQHTARQEGKSVNQLVIEIIKKHFNITKEKKFTEVYHDMDHLFGRWTDDEFQKIQEAVDTDRKIDRELWQ